MLPNFVPIVFHNGSHYDFKIEEFEMNQRRKKEETWRGNGVDINMLLGNIKEEVEDSDCEDDSSILEKRLKKKKTW